MLRRTCLFLLLLLCSCACFAGADTVKVQPPDVKVLKPVVKLKVPAVMRIDTSTVDARKFDANSLDAYKKKPEFKYEEAYNGPSLWSRFWKWFWSLFDGIDGHQKATALSWFFVILKYVLIAGGIAALIFLIMKSAGINMLGLFRGKPYSKLEYSESEENIHEIDFEGEIEKAISVNNYRLAVRLLYLRSLKQLSDNGLIDWQLSKTNTHYVNELTNGEQREAFGQLTRQFEYVWYGDFLINAEIFKRINQLFSNFKSSGA